MRKQERGREQERATDINGKSDLYMCVAKPLPFFMFACLLAWLACLACLLACLLACSLARSLACLLASLRFAHRAGMEKAEFPTILPWNIICSVLFWSLLFSCPLPSTPSPPFLSSLKQASATKACVVCLR